MKRTAFTIVEMIVVLIVIGILIGLSTGGAMKILAEAKRGQAEADITALASAVSRYERDVGSYPPETFGLCYHLEVDRSGDTDNWNGPYMNFDDDRTSGNDYEDPWGSNYLYSNPGINNTNFVDIWSTGGSGATIGNW